MGVLLSEGIGDTIAYRSRASGDDRREEVYRRASSCRRSGCDRSRELTACPAASDDERNVSGAGRARQEYVRERCEWKTRYEGVESLTLAVMAASSTARRVEVRQHRHQPAWNGEAPSCPVYVDGRHVATLQGTHEELSAAFRTLVDEYVETKYGKKP